MTTQKTIDTTNLYWKMYKRQAKLVHKYKRRTEELNAECNRWATRYDAAWNDLDAARAEIKRLETENATMAATLDTRIESSAALRMRARTLRDALKTAAKAMDEFRGYLPINSPAAQEVVSHYLKACYVIGDPIP